MKILKKNLKSDFLSTWDAKIKAANTNDSDSKPVTYQVNPNLVNPTYDENQFEIERIHITRGVGGGGGG